MIRQLGEEHDAEVLEWKYKLELSEEKNAELDRSPNQLDSECLATVPCNANDEMHMEDDSLEHSQSAMSGWFVPACMPPSVLDWILNINCKLLIILLLSFSII